MTTRARKDRATVYAYADVHAGVEIKLEMEIDGDTMRIEFGDTGPDLILEIADLDSMERLAEVAAEGVRLWHEDAVAARRLAEVRSAAGQSVGVAR